MDRQADGLLDRWQTTGDQKGSLELSAPMNIKWANHIADVSHFPSGRVVKTVMSQNVSKLRDSPILNKDLKISPKKTCKEDGFFPPEMWMYYQCTMLSPIC